MPGRREDGARSRRSAVTVLERTFGTLAAALRVRLWDGTEVRIGTGEAAFTLVVRDRATFRQVFGTTRTQVLAEAFVDNRIDVEGDLFAALRLAARLEGYVPPGRARLAIRWALRRV